MIGGRLDSLLDAAFVPPPEDDVPGLLEDLVAFVRRDDLPAIAQAAIAHAQFEGTYDRQFAATELFDLVSRSEERIGR